MIGALCITMLALIVHAFYRNNSIEPNAFVLAVKTQPDSFAPQQKRVRKVTVPSSE